VRFVFDASCWSSVISRTFKLDTIYRQRDQGTSHVILTRLICFLDFADMLNEVRFGRLSRLTVDRFRALSRPLQPQGGIEPTEL
jgi:ATP-dependent DNA helicase PIF1